MQIKLSERLLAVAKQILPGKPAADIGTDHNYLPVYLVVNGICPAIIATDRARGPFDNASQLVGLLSLDKQIQMRLGDGLKVLQPHEAATICLAGMGGCAIREILAASPAVAQSAERLVLQPQRHAPLLRQYLVANGWRIVDEDIALDSGFYYEIIVAEPGQMELREAEVQFGPYLLAEPHPLLKPYLQLKLADLQLLAEQLATKEGVEAAKRRISLQQQIGQIEDVLGNL
jgi:tRNA (adenine22-N1)-methyltransferase